MSTTMEREIREQPDVIAHALESSASAVEKLADAIRARDIRFVMIAARGTSDNAGIYAKYLFAAFNRLPVALTTPSLFTYYHTPPRLGADVLVLGISQSGQSEDIVEVLTEARSQGALTAALTNDASSPLSANADFTLNLSMGTEKAVAATKTYTSSLAVLAHLSACLARDKERLEAIHGVPRCVAQALGLADAAVHEKVERYRYMDRCVVIGRGFNYATAFETSLKLKELTYITAEPYSSADFLHGPMAIIEPGFPVIVIAPEGELSGHLQEFTQTLSERRAEIIAVSNARGVLDPATTRFPVPRDMPEWLSPIASVIPGQFFALRLALAKGYDPDAPRGLRKVTVTR